MGKNAKPLSKVTTFKLTEEMARSLDAICARDGGTKDSVIRRMIRYGFLVDAEIQSISAHAAKVVTRQIKKRGQLNSPS